MIFAGLPAIIQFPFGNLFVTTEPAPTIVLLPTTTPGKITLFMPIQHCSPIFISFGAL